VANGDAGRNSRGFDETDATGPIAHIVGFFGPPPPL
jgi:hypothetical protein